VEAITAVVDERTVILHLNEPEPEAPLYFDQLDLVALSSAIECACLFVASTVRAWKAGFIEHRVVTIVRELVAQAVAATGYTGEDWYRQEHHQFITVRIFGFKRHIGLEVWDCSTELLLQPMPCTGDEEPAGLQLVELAASRWGSSPVPTGRVMWAELPVYEVTAAGLPLRTRKPSPNPRPLTDGDMSPRYEDFLCRVRDGLRGL
jgi:hypothetical protein